MPIVFSINVTGEEFKRLRMGTDHTQASLSKELGVHLRTVTRWEIGEVIVPKVVELALRYVSEHAMKRRDAKDLKDAKAALKEAKEKGTVSWGKFKKELKLKPRRQKH
jgi:DNA-binding XRE family transcriptional regulator